jgi:hypothetical protein
MTRCQLSPQEELASAFEPTEPLRESQTVHKTTEQRGERKTTTSIYNATLVAPK